MNCVKTSLLAAALLMLGGCASAPPSSAAAQDDIDHEKVAQIEAAARRLGTQIIWLNLPRKATGRQ